MGSAHLAGISDNKVVFAEGVLLVNLGPDAIARRGNGRIQGFVRLATRGQPQGDVQLQQQKSTHGLLLAKA